MRISRAKFKVHCSNISGEIFDWVLYCFSETTYNATAFLICIIKKRTYLKRKKDIPKRKTQFFFSSKNPSNKQLQFFTS